jgi:hypothetical protein
MFIKRSVGQIVTVLEDEEVDEQTKKKAKDLAQQNIKTSDQTDSSATVKKSGS